MKRSKLIRREGKYDVYHFLCEGCGTEGELKVPWRNGMAPIGCPNECGATYVPFNRGLQCVVKPVFVPQS